MFGDVCGVFMNGGTEARPQQIEKITVCRYLFLIGKEGAIRNVN